MNLKKKFEDTHDKKQREEFEAALFKLAGEKLVQAFDILMEK